MIDSAAPGSGAPPDVVAAPSTAPAPSRFAARPGPFAPPREDEVERLSAPYDRWPYAERRSGVDRRARPTSMISRYVFGGGRARGRRRGEDRNIYVDRYHRADVGAASAVLLLNVLDAWLTMVYLGYGGAEANPVARKLLEMGPWWFLGAKCFAVGGCVLFLVVHKTFSLVKPAVRLLVGFYGLLLVYHLYLQAAAILHGLT